MKAELFVSQRCKYCTQLMDSIEGKQLKGGVMLKIISLDKTPIQSIPYDIVSVPSLVVDFQQIYKGEQVFQIMSQIIETDSVAKEPPQPTKGELNHFEFGGKGDLKYSDLAGEGHSETVKRFMNIDRAYGGGNSADAPKIRDDKIQDLITQRAREVNGPVKRT